MISRASSDLNKTVVLKNIEIAPHTFILSFKRAFDFVPGQVIAITSDLTILPRLYSIASGNKDDNIEILYDINQEGELTPRLSNLKKNNIIYFSLPFGSFTDHNTPAHWIATGTGVAPFVSMVKSGLYKNKIFVHGARNKEFFYFENLFKEKLGVNYLQCCSQCPKEVFFHGRLTSFLRQHKNLPVDEKYYLCGSAEMVVDVREILIKKGVQFKNIVSEIYF